jgi:hypothetical protein
MTEENKPQEANLNGYWPVLLCAGAFFLYLHPEYLPSFPDRSKVMQVEIVGTVSIDRDIGPTPPNPIPPGPDPTPPEPDNNFVEEYKDILRVWVEEVRTSGKKSEAAKIANVFDTNASMIASGVHKDVDSLMKATHEGTHKVLGIFNGLEWKGKVFDRMGPLYEQMYREGYLDTVKDHQPFWEATGSVLTEFSK